MVSNTCRNCGRINEWFPSTTRDFCSKKCKSEHIKKEFDKTRNKTCVVCQTPYFDSTKRNVGRCCSKKCGFELGAFIRKKNNSYIRTDEQNRKTSKSVLKTYASKDVFGPELRKKFSETMKKTWSEGKIDTSKHWTKTSEGRERLSKKYTGVKLGPQPKMSIAARNRVRTKRETLYTSARGGFRQDLGTYFRSGWEANVARVLTYQGKKWEFEEHSFELEPNFSYTPDFFVPDENVFYEVKGRMDEKSQRQLDLMKLKHPTVVIVLVDSERYSQFRTQYKHLINWEGK